MGRRGPPKKPTALKVLAGNPGCRRLNTAEPIPTALVALQCPSWMPKEGKEEWNRIVPELIRLGLLTVVDQGALERVCKSYADWRKADAWVAKKGATFVTPNGYIAVVPQVTMARKAALEYRFWCHEFGLTPAARANLTVPGGKQTEDAATLEKYFA